MCILRRRTTRNGRVRKRKKCQRQLILFHIISRNRLRAVASLLRKSCSIYRKTQRKMHHWLDLWSTTLISLKSASSISSITRVSQWVSVVNLLTFSLWSPLALSSNTWPKRRSIEGSISSGEISTCTWILPTIYRKSFVTWFFHCQGMRITGRIISPWSSTRSSWWARRRTRVSRRCSRWRTMRRMAGNTMIRALQTIWKCSESLEIILGMSVRRRLRLRKTSNPSIQRTRAYRRPVYHLRTSKRKSLTTSMPCSRGS